MHTYYGLRYCGYVAYELDARAEAGENRPCGQYNNLTEKGLIKEKWFDTRKAMMEWAMQNKIVFVRKEDWEMEYERF